MKNVVLLVKKLVSIQKPTLLLITLFLLPGGYTSGQTWTLRACIDSAKQYNKTLLISRNNIIAAEEKNKEAIANLFPKLSFSADYKYFFDLPYQLMPMTTFGGPEGKFKETQFGVPHNISIALQASLPIYNSQIYGAISATDEAQTVSELHYRKSEEQVILETSNLYYTAQILHHQLDFIESNAQNTNRLLENVRLLQNQLLAKGTDVEKIELQRDQLLIQKKTAEDNLLQVINALKLAIGISVSAKMQIDPRVEASGTQEYESFPVPDIQLLKAQNRLLRSELKTLKLSFVPAVALVGSYGQTGFGYDKAPNDFLKFFRSSFIGMQISMPIFTGTVTYRKMNQKEIEISNNEIQLTMTAEQIEMQILNLKNKRKTAAEVIINSESQIKLAERIFIQTELQHKEGIAGLTDLLLADSALREAQQSNIRAIIDFLKADLELKKITANLIN